MSLFKAVLASIEPLAQTLAKTHNVSIAVYGSDEKTLLATGAESVLNVEGTARELMQRASSKTTFDTSLDGVFISVAVIKDVTQNTVLLLCMARSQESSLSDEVHSELLASLATTLQACVDWNGRQRSAVLELMEKYEELTLLYDISEKLECLPNFDDVANEMLTEAINRVRCKAGRLIVLDEAEGEYFERVRAHQSIQASKLSYHPEKDPAAQCLKNPTTQLVNEPSHTNGLSDLTQLHVPICLKDSQPIGVLSLFRMLNSPFKYSDKKIAEMLARQTAGKLESAVLYTRLELLFLNSIKMLVECIDARDTYTRGHSARVSIYSVFLARKIGLPEDQVKTIEIGALLHDIGKIRIRDHILNKPGRLTNEEYEIIKGHPEYGMRIVEHVKQLHNAVPCIYCHHEHYNGTGYPRRLAGEEIPLMGRIVAIADTFDAMTTTRPYRSNLSQKDAYDELLRFSGIQFDPELAAVFAEAILKGELTEEHMAHSTFH